MTNSIIPDNTAECDHSNVELCQCITDDGRFVAHQCNDCGWVTNQDPTPEDYQRTDLPFVDVAMWKVAIRRNLERVLKRNETKVNAAKFFVRAARRGK